MTAFSLLGSPRFDFVKKKLITEIIDVERQLPIADVEEIQLPIAYVVRQLPIGDVEGQLPIAVG